MPKASHRAREALQNPGRPRRSVVVLRGALGIVLALSVLAIPQLSSPEPVAAGSSCTGWTSYASPPRTIRVLRLSTGEIQTVDFRKYVAKVMASGEWPSRLQTATLETGALVTKQYAWYYTMEGHHRSHYVRNGKCYDVRDDTADQLYRHWASPTARQQRAVEKTWNLTLRKSGRFFLTGYRMGTASTCGADANGWKIYENSVEDCAKRGLTSTQILKKYLSPNLAFVYSDTMGPVLKKPSLKLRTGNVLPGAATINWNKASSRDDVARYKVQRKTGSGAWKTIDLDRVRSSTADVWLKTGTINRFRVRARDTDGNVGPWTYSPIRKAAVRGPAGTSLSGAGVELSNDEPLQAKMRFTGRSAAFVTEVGPGMGKARVYVNGKRVAVIDLERTATTERKLVWTRNWDKAKERVVVIRAADVDERVEFDGLFTLR